MGPIPELVINQVMPPGGRYTGDPYIGNQSCAECHPGEFANYQGSGHSRTFRAAAERSLSARIAGTTVDDPEIPGVKWSYVLKDGNFIVERRKAGKVESQIIDYAFGSGHHATTFVTIVDLDTPRAFEHRMTYFEAEGKMGITPGHQKVDQTPGTTARGRDLDPAITLKCFRCHSTQLSTRNESTLDPPKLIPNISCERCHGPGRKHVELARSGASVEQLSMPMGPGTWTAESQFKLCGACHRHPNIANSETLDPLDPSLARFQPIGLNQSKCFKGSGKSLTCVGCHDPHARPSTDHASYERICLGCHGAPGKTVEPPSAPSDLRAAEGRPCSVSPASGCINCHMPKVDSGQNVLFTDHWIRVVPRPRP